MLTEWARRRRVLLSLFSFRSSKPMWGDEQYEKCNHAGAHDAPESDPANVTLDAPNEAEGSTEDGEDHDSEDPEHSASS